ncbi:MFS transporter, partial [Yersinia enterocolitica]
ALGSILGGQAVTRVGLAQTPWIGGIIVVAALLLVRLSGKLDKKHSSQVVIS